MFLQGHECFDYNYNLDCFIVRQVFDVWRLKIEAYEWTFFSRNNYSLNQILKETHAKTNIPLRISDIVDCSIDYPVGSGA